MSMWQKNQMRWELITYFEAKTNLKNDFTNIGIDWVTDLLDKISTWQYIIILPHMIRFFFLLASNMDILIKKTRHSANISQPIWLPVSLLPGSSWCSLSHEWGKLELKLICGRRGGLPWHNGGQQCVECYFLICPSHIFNSTNKTDKEDALCKNFPVKVHR